MKVAFRRLNFIQRFQFRKKTCVICGNTLVDTWSYMVDKGNFVNNPPPKYFHYDCAIKQSEHDIAESDRELAEILKGNKEDGR